MRPILPLLFLLAAACAADADGPWPSLAHRPGEAGGQTPCGDEAAAVLAPVAQPQAPPPAPPPSPPVDVAAYAHRLAEARSAWSAQLDRTEAAVAAAEKPSRPETQWATAQLELSRLEQRGAVLRDIADELGVMTSPERPQLLQGEAAAAYEAHVNTFNSLKNRLGDN